MRINYITKNGRAVIGAHNGPIMARHPVEASEVRPAAGACAAAVGVLNGGYAYEFLRYARIGERIWRSSSYLDIRQRDGRNGPMVFVIVTDSYTADGGAPLIDTLTTTILR